MDRRAGWGWTSTLCKPDRTATCAAVHRPRARSLGFSDESRTQETRAPADPQDTAGRKRLTDRRAGRGSVRFSQRRRPTPTCAPIHRRRALTPGSPPTRFPVARPPATSGWELRRVHASMERPDCVDTARKVDVTPGNAALRANRVQEPAVD